MHPWLELPPDSAHFLQSWLLQRVEADRLGGTLGSARSFMTGEITRNRFTAESAAINARLSSVRLTANVEKRRETEIPSCSAAFIDQAFRSDAHDFYP